MMKSAVLYLLCILVEVYSQTAPYITFMGETLQNHSYVDLNLVGEADDGSDSVQCHTDLDTSNTTDGQHTGHWYHAGPNAEWSQLPTGGKPLYEVHSAHRVDLRHWLGYYNAVYRCSVETVAVNGEAARESVYVGLYTSTGSIDVSYMRITVNSDFKSPIPRFTLTCYSTRGVATTVSWSRDYEDVSGEMQSVLSDPSDSSYTHTLTVTGRLGGLYQCTVANNKPSQAEISYFVQVASAPTNLTIVQEDPTSLRVSWRPPSPLEYTTGYRIYYSGDDRNGSVDVRGGSTDNYLLTGLQNGALYNISIVGVSHELPSNAIIQNFFLAPVLGDLRVDSSEATSSSISLSWSVLSGSVVTSCEVTWQRDTEEKPGKRAPVGNSTRFNITDLHEDSMYIISLVAMNAAGRSVRATIMGLTMRTDDAFVTKLVSTSPTSVTITLTLADGVNATNYSISYSNTNTQCFTDSNDISGITASTTVYTLTGLQEATEYSIIVTAILSDGRIEVARQLATTEIAAPSSAITSVSVSRKIFFNFTVQWGPVDCIHRNGDITGYSVRYGVRESGNTQTVNVSHDSILKTTLVRLTASVNYSVEVAAVNRAGIGLYSTPVIFETPSSVFLSPKNDIIPNHGYVEISDIGLTEETALVCNTNSDLRYAGKWFSPIGLPVDSRFEFWPPQNIYANRDHRFAQLVRRVSYDAVMEGVYHCVVEDDTNNHHIFYVGLYNSTNGRDRGDLKVSDRIDLSVDSDMSGASPQFTLTCISTGGPATTVTWTRDSAPAIGEATTILDDAWTAHYTHTLTVTGRLGGLYQCSVANNKLSQDSANITVTVASAPTNLTIVQEDPTSMRVSWSPPSPLEYTTGYRIYYSGDDRNGSVDVSGSSTDNYLLTGLQNGTLYNISIVGLSYQLPSDEVFPILSVLSRPLQNFTTSTGTESGISPTSTEFSTNGNSSTGTESGTTPTGSESGTTPTGTESGNTGDFSTGTESGTFPTSTESGTNGNSSTGTESGTTGNSSTGSSTGSESGTAPTATESGNTGGFSTGTKSGISPTSTESGTNGNSSTGTKSGTAPTGNESGNTGDLSTGTESGTTRNSSTGTECTTRNSSTSADSRITVIAMMTGFIGFIVGVIVALLAVTLVFTAVLNGCKTKKKTEEDKDFDSELNMYVNDVITHDNSAYDTTPKTMQEEPIYEHILDSEGRLC